MCWPKQDTTNCRENALGKFYRNGDEAVEKKPGKTYAHWAQVKLHLKWQMWLACKWVAVWVGFKGTEIDQTRAKNISLANKNQMPVNFLSSFISPAKQGAGKTKGNESIFHALVNYAHTHIRPGIGGVVAGSADPALEFIAVSTCGPKGAGNVLPPLLGFRFFASFFPSWKWKAKRRKNCRFMRYPKWAESNRAHTHACDMWVGDFGE